jgi:hypothetical protein
MESFAGFSPLSYADALQLEYYYLIDTKCKRPRLQRRPDGVGNPKAPHTLHKIEFSRHTIRIGGLTFPTFREILKGESGELLRYADWWETQSNKLWTVRSIAGDPWYVKFETLHESRQLDESNGIPLLVAVAHRKLEDRTDRIHANFDFSGALVALFVQSNYAHDTNHDVAPQDYLSLEFTKRRVRATVGQQFIPLHGVSLETTLENDVQIIVRRAMPDRTFFEVKKIDPPKYFRTIKSESQISPFVDSYDVQHKNSPFHPSVKISLDQENLLLEGLRMSFGTSLIFSNRDFPRVTSAYTGKNFGRTMRNVMIAFDKILNHNLDISSEHLFIKR